MTVDWSSESVKCREMKLVVVGVVWRKHLIENELCNIYKLSHKQKIYMCAQPAHTRPFYFHSFLMDMFFSLSFCITWWREQDTVLKGSLKATLIISCVGFHQTV